MREITGTIGRARVDRELAVGERAGEGGRTFRGKHRHHAEPVGDLILAERAQLRERLRVVRGDALRLGEIGPDLLDRGEIGTAHSAAVTAGHHHRFLEQTLGHRRRDQHMHRHPPGALTDDRDVVWIAAECGDVLLDPFERSELVHVAVIAQQAVVLVRLRQRRMGERAEAPDPIVRADEQHALPGQFGS